MRLESAFIKQENHIREASAIRAFCSIEPAAMSSSRDSASFVANMPTGCLHFEKHDLPTKE